MKKHVFIWGIGFFLLFLNSYNAIAQGPPTKYDESKKETDEVKFAVKTNVMSIISGELPVTFEYKFIKKMGMEAGAGLILPYYVNLDLFSIFTRKHHDDFVSFANKKVGYSLFFAITTYPAIGEWGYFFTNPYVHFRHYSTVNVLNCGLEIGYGRVLFGALALNVGSRFYWKHQKSLDAANTQFYPLAEMPLFNMDATIFLKIGYAF